MTLRQVRTHQVSTPKFVPRTIRSEVCFWVAIISARHTMRAGDSQLHVLESLIPSTEGSRLTLFHMPDLRVSVSTIRTQPRAFIALSGHRFAIPRPTTLLISNSPRLRTQLTGRPASLIYWRKSQQAESIKRGLTWGDSRGVSD